MSVDTKRNAYTEKPFEVLARVSVLHIYFDFKRCEGVTLRTIDVSNTYYKTQLTSVMYILEENSLLAASLYVIEKCAPTQKLKNEQRDHNTVRFYFQNKSDADATNF